MAMALKTERQYHDKDGPYQLPNDAPEHVRLEVQHVALAKLLGGEPCTAPIINPKSILDIGCGTGVVTVHLAKVFPNATVVGIDLSAVPNIHEKPANVEFLQGNIMDEGWRTSQPLLADGNFDYCFSRMLFLGVPDWPSYIRTLGALLRPAGWLEMQEPDSGTEFDRNGQPRQSCNLRHMQIVIDDSKESSGIDLEIGRKLSGFCRDSRLFDQVHERQFKWPAAKPLPEDEETGTLMYEYLRQSYDEMSKLLIGKISGAVRSEAEVETMVEEAKRAAAERTEGAHYKYFVVTSQKG